MKQRFTVNDRGELEDRHGHTIGKLTSLTLEVPLALDLKKLSRETTEGTDVGGKDPNAHKDTPSPTTGYEEGKGDPAEKVFLDWLQVTGRDPENVSLTPSRRRTIDKGLAEATVEELRLAFEGLMKWRETKSGDTQLSSILQTRPGGRPLREQIEFFMGQLGDEAGRGRGVTSEEMVKINRAKDAVTTAFDMPGSGQAQETGKRARAWLESKGWKVEQTEAGRPKFMAP